MNDHGYGNKKKAVVALTLLLMLVLPGLAGCGQKTPDIETGIAEIDKYGNIDLTISPEELRKVGYEPADVISVKIGDNETEMPIGTHYSDVEYGEPVCCFKTSGDGTEKTVLAIYSGNFAETSGIADDSVKVLISMVRKQGYAEEYEIHQITGSMSNKRGDYAELSDAEYANFRNVETTGMGTGVLYRSSSPINPKINRNNEADAALLNAGISTVINLADSETEMKQYEGFGATNYSACDIIALDLEMDHKKEDYRRKLADGLRFIASHDGPYLIHCNEGKERTGFVVAVLEALMGADTEEIASDYMRTFYNYFGVVQGSEQYQKISDSFLKSLAAELGVSSLRDNSTGLKKAAEDYLKKIGMTDDEIAALKDKLGKDIK